MRISQLPAGNHVTEAKNNELKGAKGEVQRQVVIVCGKPLSRSCFTAAAHYQVETERESMKHMTQQTHPAMCAVIQQAASWLLRVTNGLSTGYKLAKKNG